MVVGVALTAPALSTEKVEGQGGVGPIVRREDHQGILTQSKLDQDVLDPPDAVVHVSHHVDEVLLRILALSVLAPRGRVKRIMRQVHWVVGKKGLILVVLDEVDQVIRDDRRPVFCLPVVDDLTVMHQRGFPVPPALSPWNIPYAMPFKARFFG